MGLGWKKTGELPLFNCVEKQQTGRREAQIWKPLARVTAFPNVGSERQDFVTK